MTDTPHDPKPTAGDVRGYVQAAARLLALPLSEAQIDRVSVHLARTAALAAVLQRAPLAAHDEPAQIYEPAPFPATDPAEDPR
jgi:hypothetical protein